MSLELYFHPLASFCQKVLIAFYENETAFEPHIVDLGNEASRSAFAKLWPIAKFPVLRDRGKNRIVPESTIIIEYLAQHYPGETPLLPEDPNLALEARLWDRFFDFYIHEPMQKVVTDRLRPAGHNDAHGVQSARSLMKTAFGVLDERMAAKTWALGDTFTMADCAAAPALFYASKVMPFDTTHANAARYLDRLRARASFARVIEEARPYFAMFPQEK